jgi:hypothetical protein
MSWRFGNYDAFTGVRKDWRPDGNGNAEIRLTQDVGALLDQNREMAKHNDGYSESRDIRRVARIPAIVRQKWLLEEGWDCMDPENEVKLARKLNDPDYLYLRTAEGKLGVSNGVMR